MGLLIVQWMKLAKRPFNRKGLYCAVNEVMIDNLHDTNEVQLQGTGTISIICRDFPENGKGKPDGSVGMNISFLSALTITR